MSLSTGTVPPSYVELQGADGLLLKMPLCRVRKNLINLYLYRLSRVRDKRWFSRYKLLTASNLAKVLLRCTGLVQGEDEEGQCM